MKNLPEIATLTSFGGMKLYQIIAKGTHEKKTCKHDFVVF